MVSVQNDARYNSLCETTSGSAPLTLAITKALNPKIVKFELFTAFNRWLSRKRMGF